MKWLIASDLHGSEAACKSLLAAYEREGAQRLLLLGDLLYHGPRDDEDTKAVPGLLNSLKDTITCVRGNCDTDGDLEKLDFPVQEGYAVIPLVGDPQMRMAYATHGHVYNSMRRPPNMRRGDVILQGHTHVPMTERHTDFYCFNPGSAALPKWGSERGYMTMEGTVFVWKTLAGEEYRRFEL